MTLRKRQQGGSTRGEGCEVLRWVQGMGNTFVLSGWYSQGERQWFHFGGLSMLFGPLLRAHLAFCLGGNI